jgi:hypothetical protein
MIDLNAYETMLFNWVRMTEKEKEEKEHYLAIEYLEKCHRTFR